MRSSPPVLVPNPASNGHRLTLCATVSLPEPLSLPTEDPEAYQRHVQQFLDEYAPANATETQLVHEIANTAWRLNRIPFLEAELLSQTPNPQTLIPQLATLGLHGSRLSRQFQKAVDQLREIQDERHHLERRQLTEAAELFLRHQHNGLAWNPTEMFGTIWLRFFTRTNRAPRTKADASASPAFYAPHSTPIAKRSAGRAD